MSLNLKRANEIYEILSQKVLKRSPRRVNGLLGAQPTRVLMLNDVFDYLCEDDGEFGDEFWSWLRASVPYWREEMLASFFYACSHQLKEKHVYKVRAGFPKERFLEIMALVPESLWIKATKEAKSLDASGVVWGCVHGMLSRFDEFAVPLLGRLSGIEGLMLVDYELPELSLGRVDAVHSLLPFCRTLAQLEAFEKGGGDIFEKQPASDYRVPGMNALVCFLSQGENKGWPKDERAKVLDVWVPKMLARLNWSQLSEEDVLMLKNFLLTARVSGDVRRFKNVDFIDFVKTRPEVFGEVAYCNPARLPDLMGWFSIKQRQKWCAEKHKIGGVDYSLGELTLYGGGGLLYAKKEDISGLKKVLAALDVPRIWESQKALALYMQGTVDVYKVMSVSHKGRSDIYKDWSPFGLLRDSSFQKKLQFFQLYTGQNKGEYREKAALIRNGARRWIADLPKEEILWLNQLAHASFGAPSSPFLDERMIIDVGLMGLKHKGRIRMNDAELRRFILLHRASACATNLMLNMSVEEGFTTLKSYGVNANLMQLFVKNVDVKEPVKLLKHWFEKGIFTYEDLIDFAIHNMSLMGELDFSLRMAFRRLKTTKFENIKEAFDAMYRETRSLYEYEELKRQGRAITPSPVSVKKRSAL